MHKPRPLIALLALAAAPVAPVAPVAHTADTQPCDDATVAAVARWAGIASHKQRDFVVANACKIMPNAPDTTIAAVAFDTPGTNQRPDVSNKLQVVALVENGKVVAADRSTIEEDPPSVMQ